MVALQLAKKNQTVQNSKTKMHGLLESWSYTFKAAMGLQGLKWTYPGFKQNYRNTKRSGVFQTSEGLKWPSILTMRSEMVFRKECVSTIKRSRMNMAEGLI